MEDWLWKKSDINTSQKKVYFVYTIVYIYIVILGFVDCNLESRVQKLKFAEEKRIIEMKGRRDELEHELD